jgi:hypothetical protein
MSFYGDPPDEAAYDLRPNATCTDCGADFSKADADPGTLCDRCSDQRDAHTSLLELRLLMAKARRSTRPITEVA